MSTTKTNKRTVSFKIFSQKDATSQPAIGFISLKGDKTPTMKTNKRTAMTMLIYPKKQGRTNVPEWRKDKFLRLRGFIDALLRKTDFVVTESGTQLAGAYYIRVQRELQVVEDAKVAELLDTLYPQFTAWQRARQEAANCPAESSGRVGSTGEARARQAAQAQRNKAAQAAAEQAQLAADILSSLTKGEFEIREIYAYANASLVTYSKAAEFKVIREEIPCFNASFSAESAAKQLGLKEEGGTE